MPPSYAPKTKRSSGRSAVHLLWLLLTTTLHAPTVSSVTPGEASRNLRTSRKSADREWERMHVIRRLYGPENADVRREISRLEERMERYQTGLPPADHFVPYENHPFDDKSTRKLQDDESAAAEDNFKSMRIQFVTAALDSMRDGSNGAKIDWYKNEILPKTSDFWSSALSVVPVSGKLRIASSELDDRLYCGHSEFTAVPDQHISEGLDDTDLVLYVSGSASPQFCPERTLAVAVPCNFDQFDRPTAGAINVCLDNIVLNSDGTTSDAVIQDYVDVTIHEVAHVLGHSSNSYRFFYDPATGEPRTKRPFEFRTVTCVDGNERSLILPADNTMKFVELENGRRFASIVTEKVQAVARNQFDCQTLEGAQLENQPTRSESCTGDHWDERLYYPEALSGIISPTTNVLSTLTLALFEDSGWYKANYTNSQMSPWGLGAGCQFVDEPCLLVENGQTQIPDYSKGYFCMKSQEKGCSSEHSHKLACSVLDYYFLVPQNLPDQQYQYFAGEPTLGGPRQTDFCPVYGSTYNNLPAEDLDCTNVNNGDSFNVYNEVYGPDSKCIESDAGEGLCYKTACIQDTMQVQINVRGEWLICEEDFQQHTVRVGQGLIDVALTCPRLSQACPDLFCPFNCAGRGICNYDTTVNGTIRPTCECFDVNDTSPACSDSLIPKGGFLDDSGGLLNNVEENFFDPLIAVFVDKPSTWTTASWAWAGGLIAIFVILLLCICSAFLPRRTRRRKLYET